MKSLISSLAGARGRGEACLEQTPWRLSIGPRVQLQELFSKPFWIARWKQVRSLSLFAFRASAKFERLLFCCDYLSDLVSVLSGKLDPPAYLQENKCSSYFLLYNVSWATFFYFFSRLAVILFWQIELCFTLLSFFTLSKEFLVLARLPPSCLSLSAWISAPKQCLPLCIARLQLAVLQSSELKILVGCSGRALAMAVGSTVCPRLAALPRGGYAGGYKGRWTSKGGRLKQLESFVWHLFCASSELPWCMCLWLGHLCCSVSGGPWLCRSVVTGNVRLKQFSAVKPGLLRI